MKEKMHLFYNKNGDLLEIRIGDVTKSYMNECDNGVFERVGEKTGRVRGFVVLNFRKRTERARSVDLVFPVKVPKRSKVNINFQ